MSTYHHKNLLAGYYNYLIHNVDIFNVMNENKIMSIVLLFMSIFLTGCFTDDSSKSDSTTGPVAGEYERGIASWYGAEYDGKRTASGEIFDRTLMTAAHRTLPFGTSLQVTNLENGRKVNVKVNDRGPFVDGRIIDLSERAADNLGMKIAGLAQVSLKIIEGL